MELKDTSVLICNCGDTMAIDGKSLSKACGADNGCSVATSLCRLQTDELTSAMLQAKDQNKSLLIACTQETAVFDAVAEDNGCPTPLLSLIHI